MPIDKAREVPPPGAVPAPQILDLTRNRGYSYRRISPIVMAAPIQAERAKAKERAGTIRMPVPLALNDAAGTCAAIFGRIRSQHETSGGAQNALVEEAEQSGCLE